MQNAMPIKIYSCILFRIGLHCEAYGKQIGEPNHQENKTMAQTTNAFAAWMIATYEHNELADICNHGCTSCAPAGMIYYSETTEIFIQYRDDLFEIMSEYTANVGGNGLPDYVLNNSETFTSFANAVVWFCAESVALYATDGAYIDDTEDAA